ncbi:thioesterase superfamily protein [Gemmatirosa kalamazoonensis]|uniref:Acyl-coenzyme A thioesterase THEM4 n=1 Tax=Gemmatirosa kalamazoonensis TaxID=861299 RepID=W0RER1_9BACT|nr:PaaI family thioesterase [Gemmatirosa kalamazoonensis]AHG89594.1 thioesterase superfamily protein [Gemmatirosa kalamazoonensis]
MEAEVREPGDALAAPAGWRPLATHPVGAIIAHYAERSFVAGDPTGQGIRVRYAWRAMSPDEACVVTAAEPAALAARAWFGARAEGPPGHAHGGSMAAVLDEAMGLAVWLAHRAAVAAHLETDFRRPIPLGTTVTAETTVGPAEGTGKARATARLVGDDGTVFAEGSALFVLLGPRHTFAGGGA